MLFSQDVAALRSGLFSLRPSGTRAWLARGSGEDQHGRSTMPSYRSDSELIVVDIEGNLERAGAVGVQVVNANAQIDLASGQVEGQAHGNP